MALDTRLIGKALGLGDVADVSKAMDPAIARGERIFAEQRARKEREQVRARQEQIRQENNTAKSISLLENVNEAGVASNLRPYIMKNAMNIRNEAMEKIKLAKTPAEKMAATAEANAKIGTLAAQSSDFNNYLKNNADIRPDDISKLNQEGIGAQITNILEGKFSITEDGKFDFGNGNIADFNKVVNTNYINKRSDKYLELLSKADKTARQFGLKGVSKGFFKDTLKGSLNTVEMSDLDLMSVAVDHFGIDDFKGEELKLVERVKEDFDADGDIDDVKIRTQLRELINSRIEAASETVYGTAKNEYDKKVAIAGSGKTKTDYYGDAANMLQSVYNKLPGKLKGAEGKEQTTRAMIDIVKSEPIFGDSEIEDPAAAKDAIVKGLMEDTDLKYSKEEAESFYNKKYGNALIILNGQPVNDINGLLSAYNRKLTSAKRLTNTQMKKIINSIGTGTGTTPEVRRETNNEYAN